MSLLEGMDGCGHRGAGDDGPSACKDPPACTRKPLDAPNASNAPNADDNRAERSLPYAQPSNVVLVTSDAGLSGNMVSRLVRACQLPLFAVVLVLPLLISHMLDPSNMIALLPERWHGAEANRTGESFAEAWTWRLGCESSGQGLAVAHIALE